MIHWLARHDPNRVFLETPAGSHTYGDVLDSLHNRPVAGIELLRPRLDAGSVVDLLAVMSSGCAVVVGPDAEVPESVEPSGAATVVFTSGTTGNLKGVRLTTGNWESAVRASQKHLGNGPDDVWLLAMGLHRVGGIAIVLRSALAGGIVRMLSRFDPREFAAALRSGVTFASVVPTMLHRILDIDPGPYRGVRALLVGGGPIPDGLLERAVEAGLPVLPSYGMTETCGQVATLRPGSKVEPKAHPLPDVQLRIEGDGRIAVRGPMVSPGYLGEPDRQPDSWFVTGDLGQLDLDGALRVLGRADDVIVSGGENIDPRVIEASLTAIAGVDAALVLGVPSAEWGMEVACLYVGDLEPALVEGRLRRRLAGASIPKRWKRVDSIPTTDLGKPDRDQALRLFT
ncbi:MAG: AMP-binding protein [Actinomycetota bacterium]|nr:AMP-binding protein [Actinomycetota bacterium]